MLKNIIVLLFITVIGTAKAQVSFPSSSIKEALQRANTEGKLIFLQFEAATCKQCNEVADKGLNEKTLAQQIEQTFILLKITVDHPDRSIIAAQYNIKEFGTFFINSSGTLIHDFRRTTTNSKDYAKQIDIALEKAGEALKINELEAEYKKGNKSPGFMEALLLKKRSLNLPTDDLLEEYVTALPADSLQSARTIDFIIKMAPMVGSIANKTVRQNALFNKIWYAMDNTTRSSLNGQVIYKSMEKAIKNRNEGFARNAANFAKVTNTIPLAGQRAYDKNMLYYYEAIDDTATYFKKAIVFFEQYLMTISVDSIKKIDSITQQRAIASSKKDTVRTGNSVRIYSKVITSPAGQYYANELHDGALNFYRKTNNTYLLSLATEWAAKAVSFYESPEIVDTYARLLYKQGNKYEAIALEHRAIKLKQDRGFTTNDLETVLQKMEKGAVAIE